MAQHSVQIDQVPSVEILHKDLEITVKSDGELLGRLTISKGGVGWYPANAQLERHYNWERFDRLVREDRG
jgi:hypothetical protein